MKRAMVVDDDPQVLSLTARCLQDAGYETVLLSDFREARLQMQVCEPSVVVADIRLGSFNGMPLGILARLIRWDVGLVIMSGFDDPVLRRDAAEIHAEYLPKPFRPSELIEAVARASVGGAAAARA